MILTVRTDKPEAEVGLYEGEKRLSYIVWQAHRELGITIHKQIEKLLHQNKTSWEDIEGIIFYKGPGSFTGLRIGASVVNALAYSNKIPVSSMGSETWIESGIESLKSGSKELAIPEYGSEPHTTTPRK